MISFAMSASLMRDSEARGFSCDVGFGIARFRNLVLAGVNVPALKALVNVMQPSLVIKEERPPCGGPSLCAFAKMTVFPENRAFVTGAG
jgi:hypothetical protein